MKRNEKTCPKKIENTKTTINKKKYPKKIKK